MSKLKPLIRSWRYTATILRALPSPSHRKLLQRMLAFSQALPGQFNQPLPVMLAHLTPTPTLAQPVSEAEIRRLADAVAAWHFRSSLGICLRRSLLRYHFLREANIPVSVIFGARLKDQQQGGGLGGHAWLTLHGAPYYENPGDYQGFVIMYQYPPTETQNQKAEIQNLNLVLSEDEGSKI